MCNFKSIKKSNMKPLAPIPKAGIDKNLLSTLVSSYETSRQTIKSLIDPDVIMKAKTTQELATQLEFLAKVIVAERELTDQFINNLKKLGE